VAAARRSSPALNPLSGEPRETCGSREVGVGRCRRVVVVASAAGHGSPGAGAERSSSRTAAARGAARNPSGCFERARVDDGLWRVSHLLRVRGPEAQAEKASEGKNSQERNGRFVRETERGVNGLAGGIRLRSEAKRNEAVTEGRVYSQLQSSKPRRSGKLRGARGEILWCGEPKASP
jgi:hypothetical protein